MLTSLFITRRHSGSEGARAGASRGRDSCGMRRAGRTERGTEVLMLGVLGAGSLEHHPGLRDTRGSAFRAWGSTHGTAQGTPCTTRGPRWTMPRAHNAWGGHCVGLGTRGICHSTQKPPWRAPHHLSKPSTTSPRCQGRGPRIKEQPRFSKHAPTAAAPGVPTSHPSAGGHGGHGGPCQGVAGPRWAWQEAAPGRLIWFD